ncbi:MAG: hypothetical protein ABR981_00480 [Candidatus Micrarchaeaceae archaeon]|jgi:hypothetical protein
MTETQGNSKIKRKGIVFQSKWPFIMQRNNVQEKKDLADVISIPSYKDITHNLEINYKEYDIEHPSIKELFREFAKKISEVNGRQITKDKFREEWHLLLDYYALNEIDLKCNGESIQSKFARLALAIIPSKIIAREIIHMEHEELQRVLELQAKLRDSS